jgi:carbonic anhydrase
LRKVQPAIARETITVAERNSRNEDFVYNVTQLNVLETIKFIESKSEIIARLVADGSIKIVGGLYDLESRRVDFIEASQTARITMPGKIAV